MSDTPRTDAYLVEAMTVPFIAVQFARDLEREIAQLKRRVRELEEEKAELKERWRRS